MPQEIISPSAAAAQIQELWLLHQKDFASRNPPPAEPAAAVSGLHWTVRLMMATAIALGLGVAMRTASAFHAAAASSGSNQALAWLEAFAFVAGVEGGMAAFGFRHAYRAALDGKAEHGFYALFLQVAQWSGLAVLVSVSALAGLWQALALDDTLVAMRGSVLFALAAVMGAGVSVAVFLLFEAAGAEAARGLVLAEKQKHAWRQDMKAWREAMKQEFDAQPGVVRLRQLAYGRNAARGLPGQPVAELPAVQERRMPTPPKRDAVKLRKTLAYLAENYQPGETVMETRRSIAETVGVSPALVQKAVNMWQESPDTALAIASGDGHA